MPESFPNQAHNDREISLAEYEQLATPLGLDGLINYNGVDPIYADSTGLQVKSRANWSAMSRGSRYNSQSGETIAIPANSTAGTTRIDLIVLRLDRAAAAPLTYTLRVFRIGGVASANPVAPSPVRNDTIDGSGVFDLPLATVSVPYNATTIAALQVVNKAWWVSGAGYTGFQAAMPPPAPGVTFRANDTGNTFIGTSGGTWQTLYRDTGWVSVTPASGWGAYNGLRFRIINRTAHMVMNIQRTGAAVAATTSSVVYTLARPYWPDGVHHYDSYLITNPDHMSNLSVSATNGAVTLSGNSTQGIAQNGVCIAATSWPVSGVLD